MSRICLILMLIGPTEVSGGGFQSYMYRSYGRPPVKAAEIVIATNNGAAKSAETGFGTKNGGRIRREAPPPGEPAPDRSLATITALSLVSSAIVIFSPAASVYRCVAGKATEEEINGLAAPYFFLFAQSYFWALFGLEANNAEIANINIFGTVVCVIYLVVMAACLGTPEEGQKSMSQYQSKFGVMAQTGMTVRMLLGYGVLLCAVVSVFELLVEDDPLRSELLAYTALCFNISIFLYPMRQCADAIRKGTTVGFPVALSVAGFVSCALWAQYSALTHNYQYLIPNVMGCLCNGFQICVVGWIYIFRNPSSDDLRKFDARFSQKSANISKDVALPKFAAGSGESEDHSPERLDT